VRQRFKTYNIPIYIAGHIHWDTLEADPYSDTLLLAGQRGGMGHHRLITLQGFEGESIEFKSAWD